MFSQRIDDYLVGHTFEEMEVGAAFSVLAAVAVAVVL